MVTFASDKKLRRNLQSSTATKINELYDSQDVIKLYGISRNTLTNWVKAGLACIEGEPRLFLGAALNAFHQKRKAAAYKSLGLYDGYCPGCRAAHSLLNGDIKVQPLSTGIFGSSAPALTVPAESGNGFRRRKWQPFATYGNPIPERRLQTNMLP